MQFTQSQISEIFEQILQKESGFNEILKLSLETLMKIERSEHNQKEKDVSNGYRPRRIFGQGKQLELRVPRTREGNFYPIILSLLKDQEEEMKNLAFKLYSSGLTTIQVGEIFDEIYGKQYSSSHVSRMFDTAKQEVEFWLNRPLDSYYPIIYIDATFIPTRRVDSVYREAYYTILGVKTDRTREVLAVVNFPTEGASQWEDIFANLQKRGVKEVDLFVSDGLNGIENSIWKYFRNADIQLCVVHLMRDILKHTKPKHKMQVSEDLKEVFRTDDRHDNKEKAQKRFKEFGNKWRKYYPSINKKTKNPRYELYFTYISYDYRIRNMIYTTNWIERLNRDFKRTTRMRGALPSPEATLFLLGSVAMNKKNYYKKVPKLNYEQQKFKWDD